MKNESNVENNDCEFPIFLQSTNDLRTIINFFERLILKDKDVEIKLNLFLQLTNSKVIVNYQFY